MDGETAHGRWVSFAFSGLPATLRRALQEVSHGSPGVRFRSSELPSMTFTNHCPDPPIEHQALMVLTGMTPKRRCSHPGQHRDLDQRETMAPRVA